MTIAPIQTRFDGGVVSQRLSGRFDSELYKKALKQSLNFEPLAQGSLRMRSGSGHEAVLSGDTRTRLIRIRTSSGQDYLAELLDHKMHLYAIDGTEILNPAAIVSTELINNGDFSVESGAGWSSKFFGPGGKGGVYFTDAGRITGTDNGNQLGFSDIENGSDNSYWIMYQKITIISDTYVNIRFAASITLGKQLIVKISTAQPTTWADQNGGGDMLSVGMDSTNGVANPPGVGLPVYPTDFTNIELGPFANTNGVIGDLHLTPGDYYVSFQIFQAGAADLYVKNVDLKAAYPDPGGSGLNIPTPWSADEAATVFYDTETGRDRTIFTHPGHAPWFLSFGGATGVWSFGNVAFTTTPVGWGVAGAVGLPAGWTAANWPSCVQIYAGRTYYAGEPAQKNRVLASKVNSPDNFTLGSNPGDALDFKIATKGQIRWLSAYRTMLAGTDVGHYSISGSTGVPLVGDIEVRNESAFQSATIQAVTAGTHALFVTSDKRRVRATTFDFQTSGWEAKDLTFVAEHITAGVIKEIHHVWTPDSVTILLLEDGTLAACTFEPGEAVLAWWTLDVGGFICSCAPAQGDSGAFLWMVVQRNNLICLERMELSEGADTLFYVDAYSTVTAVNSPAVNGDAGSKVTGLQHLAGLTARVIAPNGYYVGDFIVAVDGSISFLDSQTGGSLTGQALTIGVKYSAKAITLGKQTKTGRAASPKVGVILNNSRIPKINGKRDADRSPSTVANTVEPLFTGKKTVLNMGWSDLDEITIEQDLPFRTEICALYSVTEQTE